MTELKPCECGGKVNAYKTRQEYSPKGKSVYMVGCSECLVRTDYFETEQEAIEAWNRRAE